jgi:hypothetical protein
MSIGVIPLTAGLTTRSEIEIGLAIQECAVECLDGEDTQTRVPSFVAKLMQDGWTKDDASQVSVGALRVIAHITGNDALSMVIG